MPLGFTAQSCHALKQKAAMMTDTSIGFAVQSWRALKRKAAMMMETSVKVSNTAPAGRHDDIVEGVV